MPETDKQHDTHTQSINSTLSDMTGILAGIIQYRFENRLPEAVAAEDKVALDKANIDTVTGLSVGTRFWFDVERVAERLVREKNPDRRGVVMLLGDADGLKRTNDALGQQGGNLLLRCSAEALESNARTEDSWYRLGGGADEFTGLIRGVKPKLKGGYTAVIDDITAKKSNDVKIALRQAGLPVDELQLGMQFVGAVLEPGRDPHDLFNELDFRLIAIKKDRRSKLPDHLQKDDRLFQE